MAEVVFPEPPEREFGGRKRALCIGINYVTSQEYKLDGCGNDCRKHAEVLQDFLSFDEVRTITDDSAPGPWGTPTRENIIENLMWLFGEAEPADVLVFTYSGHGVQVVDESGQEADGYDEAIVPCDYLKHNRVILDNELLALADLRPHGTVTTCVFDCCHSGTMLDLAHCIDNSKWLIFEEKAIADRSKRTRDASGWLVGKPPIVGGRPRAMPGIEEYEREPVHEMKQRTRDLHKQRTRDLVRRNSYHASVALPSDSGDWKLTPREGRGVMQNMASGREEKDIFVLSACRDDQTALDMSMRGHSGGVLTYCLMKAFQRNGFLVDYKCLFHCISDEAGILRESDLPQLDQRFMLSFGDTKPRRQLFLGGEVPDHLERPLPGWVGNSPHNSQAGDKASDACECSIM
eukprot:gnl/MRDRNA2_/MRDRNA2_125717_c0_seq1.p1 gnl/MRDRNA2_/MRDRNA2_125717_c0~~gnl/MRDRNA2_/MRDRNA2_125717_c0_seq1.p1  ORF type:complete len:404 (-),score=67.58 gnl/MRDRNA2_/MRDRNA2_125717_c0_seq1:428-1639(-)